jgi:hypothetical protein
LPLKRLKGRTSRTSRTSRRQKAKGDIDMGYGIWIRMQGQVKPRVWVWMSG